MKRNDLTRADIVGALTARIRSGSPVIAAGSSAGIISKNAERGGVDLIVAYSTGRSRIRGLATSQLDNDNLSTLEMYDELAGSVTHTPLIGGINATDPYWSSPRDLVDRFRDTGYNGLINFPTVSVHRGEPAWDGYLVRGRSVGVGAPLFGIECELEMVSYARETEFFSMAYVFTPEQAAQFAEAGVDVVVPHVDWTVGGLVGSAGTGFTMAEAADLTQGMIDAARAVNGDVICLSHGGPISSPEDTEQLYAATDAQGFVGASSVERIPFEEAVIDTVRAFKSQQLAS